MNVRIGFPDGDAETIREWVEGQTVMAGNEAVGRVVATGVDEGGKPYAEVELEPAGERILPAELRISWKRPGEETDFG